MRFSIITPVWLDSEERVEKFTACLKSIENQDFNKQEFEHLIVNDGSILPYTFPSYPWLRVINQPNLNRLVAYNTGLKNARGEIFTLLDSDDEYVPSYLSKVDKMFKEYPEYKMFNFGCRYIHNDGTETLREPFMPKVATVGHEIFGGGNIVNGTFVFHRSVYDKLGAFPEGKKTINVPWYKSTELMWTSPYDFAAYAYTEFPEIKSLFTVTHPDHPKGLIKELGNPFGNDYYLFYKYTRQYQSKPILDYLYVVHPRN